MGPSCRRTQGSDGAAAVEFSLIAMLLFTLMYGILQFGLLYNRQQGLHAAAREGARLASLANDLDTADVVARVTEAAPPFVVDPSDGGDIDIGVDPADWCQASAADRTVTVTVALTSQGEDRYRVQLPLFSRLIPLDTEATFLCENTRS